MRDDSEGPGDTHKGQTVDLTQPWPLRVESDVQKERSPALEQPTAPCCCCCCCVVGGLGPSQARGGLNWRRAIAFPRRASPSSLTHSLTHSTHHITPSPSLASNLIGQSLSSPHMLLVALLNLRGMDCTCLLCVLVPVLLPGLFFFMTTDCLPCRCPHNASCSNIPVDLIHPILFARFTVEC